MFSGYSPLRRFRFVPRLALLLLLTVLALPQQAGAASKKPTVLKVNPIESTEGLKAYKKDFQESLDAELNLRDNLTVVDEDYQFQLSVTLRALSVSLDLGQGEIQADVRLLTADGETFFKGEIWGFSGVKVGYKGGVAALLKEAAANGAEKSVEIIANIMESGGLVMHTANAGEVTFEKRYDYFKDGDKVSILNNTRFLGTAVIHDVREEVVSATLTKGVKGVQAGDQVYLAELFFKSPTESGVVVAKSRKKKFSQILLGVLGVGLVAFTLANNNNSEKVEPGPFTSTTPATVNVAVVGGVASLAALGSGVTGQVSAALTANVLNGGNQTIATQVNWETTGGFVTPVTGTINQATFTPPAIPQIVTVTGRASNGAQGSVIIHVGGAPKRFASATAGQTFLSVPSRQTRSLVLKLYDNTIDVSGQPVLCPSGTTVRAELRSGGILARRSTLKSVDDLNVQGAAAPSITWKGKNNGTFELIVTRDSSEADDEFTLEIFNQNGEKLTTMPAGGDFLIKP